jgi:hypothetical protein
LNLAAIHFDINGESIRKGTANAEIGFQLGSFRRVKAKVFATTSIELVW